MAAVILLYCIVYHLLIRYYSTWLTVTVVITTVITNYHKLRKKLRISSPIRGEKVTKKNEGGHLIISPPLVGLLLSSWLKNQTIWLVSKLGLEKRS